MDSRKDFSTCRPITLRAFSSESENCGLVWKSRCTLSITPMRGSGETAMPPNQPRPCLVRNSRENG